MNKNGLANPKNFTRAKKSWQKPKYEKFPAELNLLMLAARTLLVNI